MDDFFSENKNLISDFLRKFLKKKKDYFKPLNYWGEDTAERFSEFIKLGKMIRGALLIWGYVNYGGEMNDEVVKAASALELFQSGILMQDDIIDKDYFRRGKRALFAQYLDLATGKKLNNPEYFGYNMGILAADIGFFWCYELLSELNVKPEVFKRLIYIFSQEQAMVCAGQMQDVYMGSSNSNFNFDKITELYIQKTARYTFSFPFVAGYLMINDNKDEMQKLVELGNLLGLIYQVKDDEFSLMGNERSTGKPVGSDIKEGKKTLLREMIFRLSSFTEKKKLRKIFGNQDITDREIEYVKGLAIKLNIFNNINKYLLDWNKEAINLIKSLKINESSKKVLTEFSSGLMSRIR
jgi:geranylgeranyl diphosphate synthase, type I